MSLKFQGKHTDPYGIWFNGTPIGSDTETYINVVPIRDEITLLYIYIFDTKQNHISYQSVVTLDDTTIYLLCNEILDVDIKTKCILMFN